jgi:hypothetical protein
MNAVLNLPTVYHPPTTAQVLSYVARLFARVIKLLYPEGDGSGSRSISGPALKYYKLLGRYSLVLEQPCTDTAAIPATTETDLFLSGLASVAKAGQMQSALVTVYARIGDLLSDGLLEVCNVLLARVDVDQTETDLLLSFLMATAASREALPARSILYDRVVNRFQRVFGEQETEALLGNLS